MEGDLEEVHFWGRGRHGLVVCGKRKREKGRDGGREKISCFIAAWLLTCHGGLQLATASCAMRRFYNSTRYLQQTLNVGIFQGERRKEGGKWKNKLGARKWEENHIIPPTTGTIATQKKYPNEMS